MKTINENQSGSRCTCSHSKQDKTYLDVYFFNKIRITNYLFFLLSNFKIYIWWEGVCYMVVTGESIKYI